MLALRNGSCYLPHKFFSNFGFQQILRSFVHNVDTAEKLRWCCALGGARRRTHPKSRVLWLLFAVEPLPVTHSYVRSGSITRAYHCCLRKRGELSANPFLSLLSLPIDNDVLGGFLGSFLLSRSSGVLSDAPVAHASSTEGSPRDFFEVLLACSRAQKHFLDSNRCGK